MYNACTISLADGCQSPCKSRMAGCILFEKEIDFCMTFEWAAGQLTWESAHRLCLILSCLDQIFISE